MIKTKQRVYQALNLGNSRNKILARNVGLTSLFQFASVLISIVLLPISLSVLSLEVYGVWLTINSVLLWLGYLDLGLGSGLKNKLGEAIAQSDYSKAKRMISTAYFTVGLLMLFAALFYSIISSFLNFTQIFGNPDPSVVSAELLYTTVNVVVYLFLLRFIFQLINSIMDAVQKLFWTKIISVASQLLILSSILLMKHYSEPNIITLGLIFSLSPVVCLLGGSILFFWKNQELIPSIFKVDFSLVKEIYSVGFKFLLVQLNMLVLFQSSNLIIINYIGPSEVVEYTIAFNLFSMMNIAFSTIAAPYWSAYSNAWFQGDIDWIRSAQKKLFRIWLIIVAISMIVLLLSHDIYSLWIGNGVQIPFTLSLLVFLYMVLFTFGMIYNTFINSTGKVFLQTISLTLLTILYIPIVIILINTFNFGVYSIPLALSLVGLYTMIIAPLQSHRLLSGSATGIFNR